MPKKLQRKTSAPSKPMAAPGGAVATATERTPIFGGQRVTSRVLAEFTGQLAVLLDAGIPIAKCLRILSGQMPQGAMKRVVTQILDDVEAGTALSEAMAKHPRVFSRLYTNMVRAGEAGGVQDEILNRLAGFLEKSEAIRSKVKGALAYPVVIMIVALSVLALVFVFVIPKFKEIFVKQYGSVEALPGITRFVLGLADHLQGWWWAYALALVGVAVLNKVLLARLPAWRRVVDAAFLHFPVFGSLLHRSLVARFSRTFGTLIQSGVPHLEALEIVEGAMPNVHLGSAVRSIHASIREGAGIAVPMGESGMFDDVVVNMVDVGEQTGELDRMLGKIADRYETEVDRAVDVAFKVIEPIILVLLAVVVALIVLALFTPLLKLMDTIGR
ncbi:MAG: type II secretion system F family protein [Planctomycetes bacterium]|nr:type II secretion system F family protein [Planctomycetota bacterium]